MTQPASKHGYRLSPQQRNSWTATAGNGTAGCVVDAMGPLNVVRLRAALSRIADGNEILRTTFEKIAGLDAPLQFVQDPGYSNLSVDVRVLGPQYHQIELSTGCLNADSATFGLVLEEIARLYMLREPPPVSTDKIQYVDYAAWANELLSSAENAAGRAYWDPFSAGAALPSPAVVKTLSAHRALGTIPCEQTELLAVWMLLLWQRRKEEPVRVGVCFDGRDNAKLGAKLGGAFGPLNRWLPIEHGFNNAEGFDAFCNTVRRRIEEMAEHQHFYPGGPASAKAGFSYQRINKVEAGGVEFRMVRTWRECEKFPLNLSVWSGDEGMEARLEYETEEWGGGEAERLLEQYEEMLVRCLKGRQEPLRRLVEGKKPAMKAVPEIEGRDLASVFEEQARRQAGAAAVRCGEREWSYGELWDRARRIAGELEERLGGEVEARVGLYLERSLESVAGLLGIWGAGAVAVPMEVGAPKRRLEMELETAAVRLVLTSGELERLGSVECVELDADGAVWKRRGAEAWGGVPAERLAYVMFTSGTTGVPKGVGVPHRALSHYARSIGGLLGAQAGESWEMVTTMAADLGYTSLLGALTTGGTLVLRTVEEAFDWRRVGGCDYLKITPGHMEALLRAAEQPERVLPKKALMMGGEAWEWRLWERVKSLAPDLKVINHYGPTETAIGVMAGICAERQGAKPALGEPLEMVRAYVLDGDGEPVLDGAEGELWIGGRSLARGYEGAAQATAVRFRPDPFAGEEGARMYRSGDRVRRRAGGQYEFLGRTDDQVKIRGFRVEPREVASSLCRHPAVAQAAVIASRNFENDVRLTAYMVAVDERRPALRELRAFLEQDLPPAMMPSQFLWLEKLPLTSNGKLDRNGLPLPEAVKASARQEPAEFIPPESQTESVLAGIWSGVLKRERVGVTDNFFVLGGDSIMSIQVVARASQSGIQITPRQLFEHPTVRGLSSVATVMGNTGQPEEAETGEFPLTPIQMWFFQQDMPAPHHYNQALWLEAASPLEHVALETSFQLLHRRHDALHLRFQPALDGWRQMQAAVDDSTRVEIVDLSGLEPDEAFAAAELKAASLQASLNLVRGPLLRAAEFRFPGGLPGQLLIIAHHLAVDSVSWSILLEDLQRAYLQTLASAPIILSPRTASFRSWAERMAAMGRELAGTAARNEWLGRRRLNVAPLPPGEGTETAYDVSTSETLRMVFTAEETSRLFDRVCPAYNMQIQEVLLAMVLEAFAAWSGNLSVLVDVESHGRTGALDAPDVSRTVGWFTARYPVVLERPAGGNPEDLFKAVKEELRQISGRALHYGLLRYRSGDDALARDFAAMPQPDISFNFMGRMDRSFPPGSPFRSFREARQSSRAPATPMQFRFDINALVAAGSLEVSWTFSRARDLRETVETLAGEFRRAAADFTACCEKAEAGGVTPSDFPAAKLNQQDLDRLLEEWKREFA